MKSEKDRLKKTSRDEQAERSRQRIYDAGIELLSQNGFEETSIADICRRAGCSVGAFYHYFSSKEGILEETFRIADADFSCRNQPENITSNDRNAVIEYMRSYAELVLSNGLEFAKRFYSWKNKTFIKEGRAMQTCLVELLRNAIDAGNLTLTVTPEEACEWLFICSRGIVFHWCLYEGEFDLVKRITDGADRALRGLER